MAERYTGKVVVVTGAAAGLGRGLALGYAKEGADLVLLDIEPNGLAETAEQVRALGRQAHIWQIDLSQESQIESVGAEIVAAFPKIHVLYNNAGLAYGEINAMIDTVSMARWQFFLAVNTLSPLLFATALRPSLAAAAKDGDAAIINQSSMAAYMPATVYGVTKSALNQITWGMAHLFGSDGIRVNAIAPGLMETPASSTAHSAEKIAQLQSGQMLKAHGTTGDIVDLGLFLASSDARFITAEVMHCDAGHRLRGWRE
jgi:NAD(P)-dependent dehydrogenase (short-subunit alcohol dehydrogenase family)